MGPCLTIWYLFTPDSIRSRLNQEQRGRVGRPCPLPRFEKLVARLGHMGARAHDLSTLDRAKVGSSSEQASSERSLRGYATWNDVIRTLPSSSRHSVIYSAGSQPHGHSHRRRGDVQSVCDAVKRVMTLDHVGYRMKPRSGHSPSWVVPGHSHAKPRRRYPRCYVSCCPYAPTPHFRPISNSHEHCSEITPRQP